MGRGDVVLQGALEIAENYGLRGWMVTLRHVRLNEFVFNQKSANLKKGRAEKAENSYNIPSIHGRHRQTYKSVNLKARKAGKSG